MSDHQRDYYSDFDGVDEAREVRGEPTTVGEMLADARQRAGQELSDVAAALRIRLVYLRALEQGEFAELPGPTYASGFLRSYAEYLGLDTMELLRRFRAEVAGRDRPAELYFPTPTSEGRAPGGTILLATLIVAAMAYGGWYYLSATDRTVLDLVPALPERFAVLLDKMPWSSGGTSGDAVDGPGSPPPEPPAPPAAPAPAITPAPAPRSTVIVPPAAPPVAAPPAQPAATTPPPAPLPSASAPSPRPTAVVPGPTISSSPAAAPLVPVPPPATAPLPGITTGSRVVVVDTDESESAPQEPTLLSAEKRTDAQTPTQTPAVAPPPPAAQPATPTRVFGTQNKVSHIAILAKQDSWVQVREGSDQLFTRVLRPGDMYRLPDRPGLKLRTGNAGGLVVVKDGVEGPLLGSQGQVLRDYPLDQAGAAAPAAAGGE